MFTDSQRTIDRNARVGMVLFVIYVIFYAGFVAICAFSFKTMQTEVGGVNLAIIYGFGLIFLALLLAVVYMLICRHDDERGERAEDRA